MSSSELISDFIVDSPSFVNICSREIKGALYFGSRTPRVNITLYLLRISCFLSLAFSKESVMTCMSLSPDSSRISSTSYFSFTAVPTPLEQITMMALVLSALNDEEGALFEGVV